MEKGCNYEMDLAYFKDYFERQKPPEPACVKCGATNRMVFKDNDLCYMCESQIIGESFVKGLVDGLNKSVGINIQLISATKEIVSDSGMGSDNG